MVLGSGTPADGIPGTGPQPGNEILGAGAGSLSAACEARGMVAAAAAKLSSAHRLGLNSFPSHVHFNYCKNILSVYCIHYSRKHGEGSSAKTLALLHKLDT